MSAAVLADGELVDGKYRILGSLGKGAWGHVYEGVNERIGRRVAIKVMHAEFAAKTDMRHRFEREARAATRIESEHVVHVFDMGVVPDGRPYIVMELLKGEDLSKRIEREGPIPAERVAIIGVQALRGLGEAHVAGILHRDVKPDNIVLVRTKHGHEMVKIVDFGISKLVHADVLPHDKTQTAQVLGSPVYMSPEQCRGARNMDHRSDLYSLGVALYEAATGHVPFDAPSFNELMFKIALEDAPDPRSFRPELDAGFSRILLKALARDLSLRYQTAEEFEAALVSWGEGRGLQSDDWRRLSASLTRKVQHSAIEALARTIETDQNPLASDGAALAQSGVASRTGSTGGASDTRSTGPSGTVSTFVSARPPPPSHARRAIAASAAAIALVAITIGGVAMRVHKTAQASPPPVAATTAAAPSVAASGALAATPPPPTAAQDGARAAVDAPAAAEIEVDDPAARAASSASSPTARDGHRAHAAGATHAARAATKEAKDAKDGGATTAPAASATATARPAAVVDGRTIRTEF